MPLYEYQCTGCGDISTAFRKIADRHTKTLCECGSAIKLIICPVRGITDIQPYKSMLTGEIVTTRSRHRNLLREHGCIEVGNETQYLKPKSIQSPPGLKETLVREVKKHRDY